MFVPCATDVRLRAPVAEVAEGEQLAMPRPVCLTCNNAGQVIEFRLVWSRVREGEAPLPCGRRVVDEADGWRQAKQLGPLDINIDVVSGAKACEACRRRRDQSKARAVSNAPALEFKRAQAGERSEED